MKSQNLTVKRTLALALASITVFGTSSIAQSPLGQSSATQSTPAVADWLTDGGDPQRTAWQKNEHILSVSNVKGMKLLWKYKTDGQVKPK